MSKSTVADAVNKHGLNKHPQDPTRRPQHVPYGYDFKKGKLVRNRKEQQTIRMVGQLRAAGFSLRDIAAHLNRKLIPTKRGGVWDHSHIRAMLNRKPLMDP